MLDFAWTVWRRRWWVAVLVFAVPFTAAASFIRFMPPVYESTATLLVERQQIPEGMVQPTVTSSLETRLKTISQEILSRSRMEALVNRFNLYADLRASEPVEVIVGRMRSDIRLDIHGSESRGRGSTVAFGVSFRGRDPATVAEVANTLASFFIEEDLSLRGRQAAGTARFLKVQLEETRKRLDDQERQVSAFKKSYMGELPQQLQANLAALEQLNSQLRLNGLNRLRLEEKRDLLTMQFGGLDPEGPVPLAAAGSLPGGLVLPGDPYLARLAQLRRELEDLTWRFTEKHPDVALKRAEITALEQRLESERPKTDGVAAGVAATPERRPDAPRALPPPTPQVARVRAALAEVDAELKIMKSEDERLRKSLAVYEQRVANVPRREQEFLELSRDYESTREFYQSLTKRLDEAQLSESMEQRQKGEQFRLLDRAFAGAIPAAPNRPRLLLMALVLSAGLAVGAVALVEQRDTSFHTLDNLRGFTKAPVVASIPRIVTEDDRWRQRRRFGLAAAGTTVGLGLLVGVSYFLAHGRDRLPLW